MNIVYLSGACIVHNKKTLLLKQPLSARHPGLWGPPGGHTEGGETLIDTAIREVKEETNLDVKIKGLVASGVKTHTDGRMSVITLYCAVPLNLKNFKTDRKEVSEFVWVSLKELKKDLYPLRDPLLKIPLINALKNKVAPIDTFQIFG